MMAMAVHFNIVLTGFMGTGKTQIGLRLANVLRREFVDIDDLIEEKAGTSIPNIFKLQGERAFRQLEHDACLEASQRRAIVLATGGGTVVNPANLQALQESGILICLTATPQEILNRVGSDSDRPMLNSGTGSRIERIAILLEERAPYYNSIPCQVNTTHMTHCDVVSHLKKMIMPQLQTDE